nr:hypothetical protein [Tanacetum cinerariifolium]
RRAAGRWRSAGWRSGGCAWKSSSVAGRSAHRRDDERILDARGSAVLAAAGERRAVGPALGDRLDLGPELDAL